jgi:hypothetical protein
LTATQAALTDLKVQHVNVTAQMQSLTESLAAESGRRTTAEQQAAELAARRTELEQELAKRSQVQLQLRGELAEQAQRLEARVQAHNVEVGNLALRTKELTATQAALTDLKAQHVNVTAQMQSLTDALAAESGRRTAAEQQAAELVTRRTELEQELAKRSQVQGQLRAELAEQAQRLEARVQAHNVEVGNLALRTRELTATQAALTDLKVQHVNVTAQMQSLTESLAAESERRAAAEQAWLGRESELQGRLLNQQEEIARSGATLATHETEIKHAREKIEESQVLQSALCAKIQALTEQGEATAKSIQHWKATAISSAAAAENVQRKLAGLRYAVLDTSRMNAALRREYFQNERHNLDATRQLLVSLAQTPLSLAQRRMLSELQNSINGLKHSRPGAAPIAAYPVEQPALRDSEFCLSEVTESVFSIVRVVAQDAGVAVQASASVAAAGKLLGCAEHVHQLITLLALSPLTLLPDVNALDLQVAIGSQNDRFVDLTVRVGLASGGKASELLVRLTAVTAAAATLETAGFSEAELGLAAGWQLAQAMGAQVAIEGVHNHEVRLVLTLPIEKAAGRSTQPVATASMISGDDGSHGNGNGHHNGNRLGNQNGHHLLGSQSARNGEGLASALVE